MQSPFQHVLRITATVDGRVVGALPPGKTGKSHGTLHVNLKRARANVQNASNVDVTIFSIAHGVEIEGYKNGFLRIHTEA